LGCSATLRNTRSKLALGFSAPTSRAMSMNRFDCAGSSGDGLGLRGIGSFYHLFPLRSSIKRDRRPIDFSVRTAFCDEAELSRLPQEPQPPGSIVNCNRDVGDLELLIALIQHFFDRYLVFLVNIEPRYMPRGRSSRLLSARCKVASARCHRFRDSKYQAEAERR
jgi:hypothetical protein